MARDEQTGRRRAMKLIGMLAAAVATMGIWTRVARAQSGPRERKGSSQLKRTAIRPMTKKGRPAPDPTLDTLFRDLTVERLPAAEQAIVAKTRAYAKAMTVARGPTRAEATVAKQAMLDAEAALHSVAGQLARHTVTPAQAKVAAKTAFRTYLERLEAVVGAS